MIIISLKSPNYEMLKIKGTKPKSVDVLNKNSNKGKPVHVLRRPVVQSAKPGKSISTELISDTRPVVKPKKTTQSVSCFNKTSDANRALLDYCKLCGDFGEGTNKPAGTVHRDQISGEDEVIYSTRSKDNMINGKSGSNSSQNTNIPNGKVTRKSAITTTSKTTTNMSHPVASKTSSTKRISLYQSKSNLVQEYYKNKNFGKNRKNEPARDTGKYRSSQSMFRLDPIKEMSETAGFNEDSSDLNSLFDLLPDDDVLDDEVKPVSKSDDKDSLKQLRDFRQKNYFECHSVDSRLTSRASTTSLGDHKCVYRFYLNDRLFPEPLNADHNNTIRCTKCNLPLDLEKSQNKDVEKLNGTIQAKVKVGTEDKAQDMVLLLPVKEPLIIKEKRKENKPKIEEELVYFGLIKLDSYRCSKLMKGMPMDSLALKYQKGYRENLEQCKNYREKGIDDFEVIVI